MIKFLQITLHTPTIPTNPAGDDDEAHTLLPHGIMCVSFQLGFGTSARNLKQDVITMDISRSWLGRRKTRDGPEGSGRQMSRPIWMIRRRRWIVVSKLKNHLRGLCRQWQFQSARTDKSVSIRVEGGCSRRHSIHDGWESGRLLLFRGYKLAIASI